jgi:hypothetical protein
MAVLNAQYKHPTSSYSQGFKTLIDSMLKVNPQERPDIQQVPLFLCSTIILVLTLLQVLGVVEGLLHSA